MQNFGIFAPDYKEYAGSELTDLLRASSFGTGVFAAAVTGWHLGDVIERISFCAQKEAGFWSLPMELRSVRVHLLLREDHGIFN